ncbi:MAG TPA: hypothetical protein VGR68_06870 [Actinomycetota bacterium]|nr:hypothetical protein [Actinomycetota bacterium]
MAAPGACGDGGLNAIVRVDPDSGRVRQLLGRPGELLGAESAVDKLVVARSSS